MKWAWACNTLLLCSLVHSSNHTSIRTTSHLHISHMRQSHFEFNFLGTHTISLGRFTLYLFYYYLHSVKRLLLAFCLHFTIALMSLSLSIATEHFDILFEFVGFFQSFFFPFWYLLVYLCIWLDRRLVVALCVIFHYTFLLLFLLLSLSLFLYFLCIFYNISCVIKTSLQRQRQQQHSARSTLTHAHTLHTQQQRQSLSTLYGAPMFRQRPRFLHGPDHDHA